MQGESGMTSGRKIFRGPLYHPLSKETWAYWPDALLVVGSSGKIEACGPWNSVQAEVYDSESVVQLLPGQLIIPGFIDLHVHLPQLGATGCQAPTLLEWLEQHIFSAEARFSDPLHAQAMAEWFFAELLRNGTTTAAVFLTLHSEATEIAFQVAERMGNRVIMGLNLMDRNAPAELVRPTETLLSETERLYHKWHGADENRIQYAWMPRFAISCSDELLSGIGRLRTQYPQAYCHTHLSEQPGEVAEVLKLFPEAKTYTDAYDRCGLLGERTLLAHGIHLSDSELDHLQAIGSSLVHCPSSNFFLKSGPFRLQAVIEKNLRWGLGSDVGAGPEMSLFKVMKDAQFMQQHWLVPLHTLFYAATLGGAEALQMADRLGNLVPGKEADFVILDCRHKSSLTLAPEHTLEELLSKLIYLGDDRLIAQTYVRGKRVYDRSQQVAPPSLPVDSRLKTSVRG